MASVTKRSSSRVVVDDKTGKEKTITIERYRARYRDEAGKEHARHFIKRPMPNDGSMKSRLLWFGVTMSTRLLGRSPLDSGSGVGRRCRLGLTAPPRPQP